MESALPSRRKFLNLTRQILVRFNADLAPFDSQPLHTDVRVGVAFALDEAEFALIHCTPPELDDLVLIQCSLGELPRHAEHATCARLLSANYEFSSLSLTGLSLNQETREVLYSQSCAMQAGAVESMAALLKCMATLAQSWRSGHIFGAETLPRFLAQATPAPWARSAEQRQ